MKPSQLLLLIAALVSFAFGFASPIALAQGTYECVWGGEEKGCLLNTNPGAVSCDKNYTVGNCRPFTSSKECLGDNPRTCILGGTTSCEWKAVGKDFLNRDEYGCRVGVINCVTGYEPPTSFICEAQEFQKSQAVCESQTTQCVQVPFKERGAGTLRDTEKGSGTLGGDFQINNPLQFGTIPKILDAVANFLFTIGIALVTVMVLWAGFQILTSAGSSEQIDKGKRTLLWAVIGTVVLLISFGIAKLIENILGGAG